MADLAEESSLCCLVEMRTLNDDARLSSCFNYSYKAACALSSRQFSDQLPTNELPQH